MCEALAAMHYAVAYCVNVRDRFHTVNLSFFRTSPPDNEFNSRARIAHLRRSPLLRAPFRFERDNSLAANSLYMSTREPAIRVAGNLLKVCRDYLKPHA